MSVAINGDTGASLVQDGSITAAKLATAAVGSAAPQKMLLMAAKATTSGTSIDFSPADGTGIPSWAKEITILLNGTSLSGTDHLLVQLGTSGGFVQTGYNSNSYTTATGSQTATIGFVVRVATGAASMRGHITLTLVGGTDWISSHVVDRGDGNVMHGGGGVTLGGTLDRIRMTTLAAGAIGTNTFDGAGSNVSLLIKGY